MKIIYYVVFLMNHSLFSMSVAEKLICVYGACLTDRKIFEIYAAESEHKNSSCCSETLVHKLRNEIIQARLKRRSQLLPKESTELSAYEHKYTTELDFLIELWKNHISYKKEKKVLLEQDVLFQHKQAYDAALNTIRKNHQRMTRMLLEHANRMQALLESEIRRCSGELSKCQQELLLLQDNLEKKRLLYEENYLCPICLMPMKEAKISSNCADNFHLFCVRCAKKIIDRKSACPVCKRPRFNVFRQVVETPLKFFDEVP